MAAVKLKPHAVRFPPGWGKHVRSNDCALVSAFVRPAAIQGSTELPCWVSGGVPSMGDPEELGKF